MGAEPRAPGREGREGFLQAVSLCCVDREDRANQGKKWGGREKVVQIERDNSLGTSMQMRMMAVPGWGTAREVWGLYCHRRRINVINERGCSSRQGL